MKRKVRTRIGSILLTSAMLLSLLPSSALAAEEEFPDVEVTETQAIPGDLSDVNNWIPDRTEPENFKIQDGEISFSVAEQPGEDSWYGWQGRKAFTEASVSNYWKVSYTMDVTESMMNTENVNASLWIQVNKNESHDQGDNVADWAIVQFINKDGAVKLQAWNSNGSGSWNDIDGTVNQGTYTITTEFFNGTVTQSVNGDVVNTYEVGIDETAPVAVIAQGRSYGAGFDVSMSVPAIDTTRPAMTFEVADAEELKDALSRAENGDTIKLMANIDVTSTVTGSVANQDPAVVIKKAITFDGNGKTINANGFDLIGGKAANSVLDVQNVGSAQNIRSNKEQTSTVIIKDLDIISDGTAKHGLNIVNSSDVQIENVSVSGVAGYDLVVNSSNVTVNDMTSNGGNWGSVNVDAKGSAPANITIKDGSFAKQVRVEGSQSSNVTVEGGELSSLLVAGEKANVEIAGGVIGNVMAMGNESMSITGGTFTESVFLSGKDSTISGGTFAGTVTVQVKEDASISGGVFQGEVTIAADSPEKAQIITGGKFEGTVPNDNLKPGYSVGEDGSVSLAPVMIATDEDLVNAIKNQANGQTWVFTQAGEYDAYNAENYSADKSGLTNYNQKFGGYVDEKQEIYNYQGEYAFPIFVDNLTIKAASGLDGQVTLTSSMTPDSTYGGVACYQNFITVAGDNVTIDGVNIKANQNGYYENVANKAIEVIGQNFILKNSDLIALTAEKNGKTIQNSGSIYFSSVDAGDSVIENVNLCSWISGRHQSGHVSVTNVTEDYTNHNKAGVAGYTYGVSYNNAGDVDVSNLTVIVDNTSNLSEQVFSSPYIPDGTTVQLAPGTYSNNINIDKSITLKGANANESVITGTITINNPSLDVVIDGLKFETTGHIMSSSNNQGTNLTIQNCVADGLSNTFVYTSGSNDARMGEITVKNNKVTNIIGNNLSAFNLWNASEHEITGNYVENVTFHAFNLDSTVGNVLFENNIIKNTGKGGIQLANYTTGESVIIRNNTFENVANKPYYNDDEAQGLNYAAIRVYSSGDNTDKGITANIDISNNNFVDNPISVWVSSRKTEGDTTTYFDVNVELYKNKFEMTEDSIYAVYAGIKNTIDASHNYWGSADPKFGDIIYTANGKVVSEPYYEAPTMRPEDLNTYVPPVDGGSSSGGDTAPSGDYIVFVETDGNGRVILSPSRADKGDTVSITVKPDKGYDLDELTVTDNKGKTIKLTSKGDNQYTFEMPGSEVTVEASFVSNGEPVSDLPFYDVSENDWFYDAVVYAYENELMSGTSAHTFAPNSQMTRAMIWTVLAAYEGENTSGGATWYEAGQKWAMDNGISDGTNPNGAITREQLAVMLWRYAGSPKAEMSLASYTDASAVSSWAVDAMAWAIDNGLISGMGNGILAPQGNATRAQVATIMMQFVENI